MVQLLKYLPGILDTYTACFIYTCEGVICAF